MNIARKNTFLHRIKQWKRNRLMCSRLLVHVRTVDETTQTYLPILKVVPAGEPFAL